MKLPTFVPTLPNAIVTAREFLAQAEAVDIHDRERVIESHASLTVCLGQLLAALDAEQGVTR
ncbi:hypothetical protein [Streptomyces antimycoticus]|uniref:hypothetical protein n=1 Tax=Streptomyces antimycoticus TaxID=68175 RepID=UPI002570D2B5|nr:hypothetical protein [Streptomyces antimycoticus]WJD99749.1 hypothetical protein QR300_29290 [Streptomyces antimycoticus]